MGRTKKPIEEAEAAVGKPRQPRKAKDKLLEKPPWNKKSTGRDEPIGQTSDAEKGNLPTKGAKKKLADQNTTGDKRRSSITNGLEKQPAVAKQIPAPPRPVLDPRLLGNDDDSDVDARPLSVKKVITREPRAAVSSKTKTTLANGAPIAVSKTGSTKSNSTTSITAGRRNATATDVKRKDTKHTGKNLPNTGSDSELSTISEASDEESDGTSGSRYSGSSSNSEDDEDDVERNASPDQEDQELVQTSLPAGTSEYINPQEMLDLHGGVVSDSAEEDQPDAAAEKEREPSRKRKKRSSSPSKKKKKPRTTSKAEDAANEREHPKFKPTNDAGDARASSAAVPSGRSTERKNDITATTVTTAGTTNEQEHIKAEQEDGDPSTNLTLKTASRMNKKTQSAAISTLLDAFFVRFTADLMFTRGVWTSSEERFIHHRAIIEDEARSQGQPLVADRIRVERPYARAFIRQGSPLISGCEQRNSILRGSMKSFANRAVEAEYGLTLQKTKNECAALVAELLSEMGYAYPGNIMTNEIDGDSPFGRPIFKNMVHELYFHSGRGLSLGASCKAYFTSSISTLPDELEIPVPLIALTCACIALALADWTLGKCQEYSKFSAAQASIEYKVVVDTLATFKKDNPMSFHKVMHKLFVDTSGFTPSVTAQAQQGHEANVQGALRRLTAKD